MIWLKILQNNLSYRAFHSKSGRTTELRDSHAAESDTGPELLRRCALLFNNKIEIVLSELRWGDDDVAHIVITGYTHYGL